MDTLLRHWNMLRLIPRQPHRITATRLVSQLEEAGYPTTLRTVQRDLNSLALTFPLTSDEHKPAGWSWARDAELMDLPEMDPRGALTFQMAGDFLGRMLPATCVEYLGPHLRRASKVLQSVQGTGLPAWRSKVAVVTRSQPLLAPPVAEEVLAVVYEALLRGRRFRALYTRRGSDNPREHTISPLGVVFADQVIYLVCCMNEHTDPVLAVLHRFSDVQLLDQHFEVPKGFELRRYLDQGGLGFGGSGAMIHLKLLFDAKVAHHLGESPLSADQQMTWMEPGKVLVEATVQETERLRWWIQGFGEKVEVVAPAALREQMSDVAKGLARLYLGQR